MRKVIIGIVLAVTCDAGASAQSPTSQDSDRVTRLEARIAELEAVIISLERRTRQIGSDRLNELRLTAGGSTIALTKGRIIISAPEIVLDGAKIVARSPTEVNVQGRKLLEN
jgi:hypothetical protein